MLAGVCIGTNNLAQAGAFYDRVLGTISMHRILQNEVEIGYGTDAGAGSFWVLTPFNKKAASNGNGTQLIFQAGDQQQVSAFHQTAIALGGMDEGAPGPRDYRKGYYGAYCRDLDGNKLHVFYLPPRE